MANIHESYVLLPNLGKEIAIIPAKSAQRYFKRITTDIQLTQMDHFCCSFIQELQFDRVRMHSSPASRNK